MRALEIFALTGKTITQHDRETQARPPRYRARKLVLSFENRADLYARIDRRVEQMAALGLFEEVAALLKEGLSPACTAMQAIGYKEIAEALRGEIPMEKAVYLTKKATRNLAKRQMTWFRRDERVIWLDAEDQSAEALAHRMKEMMDERFK